MVQLGSNCNYTVFIVSHNEAGEMNSTGTLLISSEAHVYMHEYNIMVYSYSMHRYYSDLGYSLPVA